mmetsp:Transcript_93171/g.268136  ORF Transcript_93171/g.268136 Transcript_93171/m.268136 type:complete len:228 (-) Transcript_93171:1011-1694(-)
MVDTCPVEQNDVGVSYMPVHSELVDDRGCLADVPGALPRQLRGNRGASEASHDYDAEAAAAEDAIGEEQQVIGVDEPVLLGANIRDATESCGDRDGAAVGAVALQAGKHLAGLRRTRDTLRPSPDTRWRERLQIRRLRTLRIVEVQFPLLLDAFQHIGGELALLHRQARHRLQTDKVFWTLPARVYDDHLHREVRHFERQCSRHGLEEFRRRRLRDSLGEALAVFRH